MFDLITGNVKHAPHHSTVPLLVSITLHSAFVLAVIISTVVFITAPPPQEMMMAFVAAPPPPPPPPPPAPPAPDEPPPKPVATAGDVAPIVEPKEIAPEPPPPDPGSVAPEGVIGGIPGGVIGGLVPDVPPPPPPPPPPPEPRKPIRVGGGQLKEPALIHRVEPVYPALAVASQLEGMVILEAVVDEEGRVETVRVLRSNGVFDNAALDAVRQWRYSPVLLNGRPEKFILTVVVSFRLTR